MLPYFNTIPTKLIEERGTVEVVLAALVYISGVTTEIESRSLLSSQPVSHSLHNVNVWYEKISLNFYAAEYDYICRYLNFTHHEMIQKFCKSITASSIQYHTKFDTISSKKGFIVIVGEYSPIAVSWLLSQL